MSKDKCDRTSFSHAVGEEKKWKVAAIQAGKSFSEWVREALNEKAKRK